MVSAIWLFAKSLELASARAGRQRYHAYLDEQQQLKKHVSKSQKRKAVDEAKAELESKRNCLEKEIATLQFDADRLAKEAEAKMQLVLLTESNALRAAAKVKGRDLEKVNNELKELVKKCQH